MLRDKDRKKMTGGRRAVIFVGRRYEMLFWEIKEWGRVEGDRTEKSPWDAGVETRTLPEKEGEEPRAR